MASAFFGVAEAKALLKTGKLSSKLLQGLVKMPQNLVRLFKKLPGKLKKLQNNVLAYALSANTYIEIARFSDEGSIIIDEWLDTGQEIIAKVDDILINDEFTDALELIKKSDGALGWRLAFKEGLEREAEFANKYFIQIRNVKKPHSPPYKIGTMTKDTYAKVGDFIYAVENHNNGVPNIGGWGSPSQYTTLEEAREKLALITKFKDPNVVGGLVVRKYKVVKDLPTRKGIVGEQLDNITRELLNGGAEQIEFLEDLSNGNWENYLEEIEDAMVHLE